MDRPRVAPGRWVTRSWTHQAVLYMVAGALLMFPARYLGLIGEAAHQLVPSLLASVAFAAGFGLLFGRVGGVRPPPSRAGRG